MAENRKHKRLPYPEVVQVTLLIVPGLEELSGETFVCNAFDISQDGVSFLIEVELPVHTPVVMKIMRQKPMRSFVHKGEVRWVRPAADVEGFHMGVMFTDAKFEYGKEWLDFVASLHPPAA